MFAGLRRAEWTVPDFIFESGQTIGDLTLRYVTLGQPDRPAALALHGTGGSSESLLTAAFGGELFGPGEPLDADRYFVIIPDAIGHGGSSKPSDGMRAAFPNYTYADMVSAQYRLVTEACGIAKLRLVIGNSMGGMHTWIWGARYPEFMDALIPMAALPSQLNGRNWMLRRLLIDLVREDPEYQAGNYEQQPHMLRKIELMFRIATSGGTLAYQTLAPTTAMADEYIDACLRRPTVPDANDFVYQWQAGRGYDAYSGLTKVIARVLAIVAADDERNPLETGLMLEAIKRIRDGKMVIIPSSDATRGHLTTSEARHYKQNIAEFLQGA